MTEIAPGAPRERQTLRLPEQRLESLRSWAVDGTGLTAAARVRDPAGRIALVRNGWSDGWLPPGGAVEPGETPSDAARREVREETGLNPEIGDPLVVLDQTYVSERDDSERLTAEYVLFEAAASGKIPEPAALGVTDDEIQAARWFDELPGDLHDDELLRPYL